MCYASAAATGSLYSTDRRAGRGRRGPSTPAPALVALYGPILDVHSLGEVAMTKTTVTYGVLVMALCIALVRRHTRVEEESGRAELLGALGVDPAAPLLQRRPGRGRRGPGGRGRRGRSRTSPAACRWPGRCGSRARGWGSDSSAPGIAAVAAQLSASARTCGAIAAGAVAVLFLLRAVGDTTVALAQLALAARLVDPAPRLVRPAWVGPPARPRGLPSSSSALPSRCVPSRPRVGPDRRAARPGHRLTPARRRAGPEPARPHHVARALDRRVRGDGSADGSDHPGGRVDARLGRCP